jgi:hypothetical protein
MARSLVTEVIGDWYLDFPPVSQCSVLIRQNPWVWCVPEQMASCHCACKNDIGTAVVAVMLRCQIMFCLQSEQFSFIVEHFLGYTITQPYISTRYVTYGSV